MIAPVARGLAQAAIARDRRRVRIVIEKPLGRDLEWFKMIDETLTKHFQEPEIFRVDHFLGKETVQNFLAYDANEIRNKKLDVLRACRKIPEGRHIDVCGARAIWRRLDQGRVRPGIP